MNTNRSNPWLKWGIVAAVIIAGFLFLNISDYAPLRSLRGSWSMGQGGYGGHMMGYGAGYGMGIGMLLFWGLIIFAIVSLVSGFFSRTNHSNATACQSDTPLEILKKRYARGEIDKAEYDRLRRDLEV